MARITVEDCLENVNNRFTLIHMAAKRVRQLRKGVEPTIVSKNKDVVISLREIAAGNVIQADSEALNHVGEDQPEALPEETKEETSEKAPDEENETEQPSTGN